MIKYLSKIGTGSLRGIVLLRLDFNTEDDWRMMAALPTINYLLRFASGLIIISHKGRPHGLERKLSLRDDADRLSKLLKEPVRFISKFDFPGIKTEMTSAGRRSIFLLENLRFLGGEEKNDKKLAKNLASLADYYVNDAFAVSHRANASIVAVTRFLPSYAGFEMEKEIKYLSLVMKKSQKPLVFILGGAKAGDKLGAIQYFKNKASCFLLGGGPANTILHLRGVDVKKSTRDKNPQDLKELRRISNYKNVILPSDFVWRKNAMVDFGSETAREFGEIISRARTIIWSGPMGLIEKKPYDRGTLAIVRAIVKNRKAFSLAGGGETVMFLKKHKLDKKFSFISTGGGAMLDFLAGKKLPGILALQKSKK